MSSPILRPAEGVGLHRYSRRVRIGLLVGAVVLVVAVVATAVGVERWRTSLRDFGGVGNLQGGPVAIGHTVYAGEYAWPVSGSQNVHLASAVAVVTTNTADADVKVLVCTIAPRAHIATIGMVSNARPYCTSLQAFTPGTFALREDKVDIVLAITPHRPGHVHVAGVKLSYSEGFRHGTQNTGINVHTRTPPS